MAEPLRYVFDTIELGCFSERQWVAKTLGALDALFEKDGIAIDGYRSDASLYLVVGWANTRIMQESELFFLVVKPEDHSIPIALPSQAKYQRLFFSTVYLFASSRMIASTLFLNVIRSRDLFPSHVAANAVRDLGEAEPPPWVSKCSGLSPSR